jgi:hypothetical protein
VVKSRIFQAVWAVDSAYCLKDNARGNAPDPSLLPGILVRLPSCQFLQTKT